jgi:hypothetical protein
MSPLFYLRRIIKPPRKRREENHGNTEKDENITAETTEIAETAEVAEKKKEI